MDSDEGSMSQQNTSSQAGEVKRGKNWSEDDDAQLCLSWIAISKDSIKGTDQNKTNFWTAIKDHAGLKSVGIRERPVDGLRQRFSQLSHQVSKYVGCLAFVSRAKKSGESSEDKFQTARDMFLKETKQRHFKIEKCYEILKNEPKFQVPSSNKRIRIDEIKLVRRSCRKLLLSVEKKPVHPPQINANMSRRN
ncbi:AAEL015285-PA [Aedes aegypti]|uniref:AAEL015285-PA n=2 Tax=Aedes aegypti TaxID=7159 RepID=A0A1S4G4H8_AEDAE|nr:glutathione S-transferase T3 isoform X2 [Aedes aegypti]EAT32574.1 AAEL015285-PA [Aedes aegypti]